MNWSFCIPFRHLFESDWSTTIVNFHLNGAPKWYKWLLQGTIIFSDIHEHMLEQIRWLCRQKVGERDLFIEQLDTRISKLVLVIVTVLQQII